MSVCGRGTFSCEEPLAVTSSRGMEALVLPRFSFTHAFSYFNHFYILLYNARTYSQIYSSDSQLGARSNMVLNVY